MDDTKSLTLSACLGAMAGLRSSAAPLTVSRASREGALSLKKTPLSALGTSTGAHIAAALAVGEAIADKTPWIPNRTSPSALTGRCVSGALAAASVAVAGKRAPLVPALVGVAAAVGSAFAGYQLRKRAGKRTGLPDWVLALVEDAVVVGAGLRVIRALGQVEPRRPSASRP